MPKRSALVRFVFLSELVFRVAHSRVNFRQSMLLTWKPSGGPNTTSKWPLESLGGIIRRNARYLALPPCFRETVSMC
jgi:hypothetical protein